MIREDYGCDEVAPKCTRCGHSLVWRKDRLFQPIEPAAATTVTSAARPSFTDFRGGWICPDCDGPSGSEK
jgi:hypothetical protein